MIQQVIKFIHSPFESYATALFSLQNVLDKLVSRTSDMKTMIGRFQEYLEYDDVRYETLGLFPEIVKSQVEENCQQVRHSF